MSLAQDIGGAAGTVSRVVALDLLQAVLRRHRPLDQAIADHPGRAVVVLGRGLWPRRPALRSERARGCGRRRRRGKPG